MKFVVTAGPTREPIDPVRFLSNRSSGKMGYAIAEAALAAGHEVSLVSGPVNLRPPDGAKVCAIETSEEMHEGVFRLTNDCDVVVMCAAVADYKPVEYTTRKLKKSAAPLTLVLVPTRDILKSLGEHPRSFFLVGFAAETNDLEHHAQRKLVKKNCDMIVANDVSRSDSGIGSEHNELIIFSRSGERKVIARAEKKVIARELIEIILDTREKSLTKKS